MNIILTLVMASSASLAIDLPSLEVQARAEALQPVGLASRGQGPRMADLTTIRTICSAAAQQPQPEAFIATLSSAYRLTATEALMLRSNCAAFLAGRAVARGGGTY